MFLEERRSVHLLQKISGTTCSSQPIEQMFVTGLANFFALLILTAAVSPFAFEPCTNKKDPSKYLSFVHKHVVQFTFDRNSIKAWERYLRELNLWCRTPMQTFMEDDHNVEGICVSGHRVANGGNLCISQSELRVYDVLTTSDNNGCRINVTPRWTYVILACDWIDNLCLPVHYERYRGQHRTNVPCLTQANWCEG